MKLTFKTMTCTALSSGALLLSASASATVPPGTAACWVETASSTMDAAMGGAGIRRTSQWHSTVSTVLFRHGRGDVLIDTGFGPDAAAQMSELPAPNRDFGMMILDGAKNRTPLIAALANVDEAPNQVKRIVVTHAHYDHLGGATTLSAPIYLAAKESVWLAQQSA
ncbi:MAG: MBL fold metallo-hydrolase, partial [Pseudomonadota bacterium]